MEDRSANKHTALKTVLLVLLAAFSAAAIIFSLVVLFTDLKSFKTVSPAQGRAMFTGFAYQFIDEIHPRPAATGARWEVTDIEFQNNNFAVVDATDGANRSRLEMIFVIESPNVRVLKINDVTARDLQDAQLALIRFLDALRNNDFESAALFYGGPLARLAPYSGGTPEVVAGLEGYCTNAAPGGSCPSFKIVSSERDAKTGSYRFDLTYSLNEKPLEVSGGRTTFQSVVEYRDGEYLVLTLPFD